MTLKETYRALRPALERATGLRLPVDPGSAEIIRILGDLGGKYADRPLGTHKVAQVVDLCRVAYNINPIKGVHHVDVQQQ